MAKKNERVPMRHARLIMAFANEQMILGVSKGKFTHAAKLLRGLDAMTLAGAADGDEEDKRKVIYFFGATVMAGLLPNDVGPEDVFKWLANQVGPVAEGGPDEV